MTEQVFVDLGENLGSLNGTCASGFEPVLDQFIENFRSRGEIGASACITFEGETVLDVWGGLAKPTDLSQWENATVAMAFSCTKGVVAMVANILIDRGLLDPYQPVAEIWPEFACKGKETATVRMMLDHTVGVPALRAQIKPDGYYDWNYMCDLIAAEEAFWIPGSMQGYHATTWGWNVGELIRRVTGRTVGANIQELLSEPMGLDLWCGLPEEIEPRVAPVIRHIPDDNAPLSPMVQAAMDNPDSPAGLLVFNDGGWQSGITPGTDGLLSKVDERASHAAEIPGGNAIMNARGLAGAYRPFALGGSYQGKKYVGSDTLVGMEEVSSASNYNMLTQGRGCFTLGFMKGSDNRRQRSGRTDSILLGRRAFGHPGAGGSMGFADPEAGMSFGYIMNQMGGTMALNDRGNSLIEAAYLAAGFKSNSSGFWVK